MSTVVSDEMPPEGSDAWISMSQRIVKAAGGVEKIDAMAQRACDDPESITPEERRALAALVWLEGRGLPVHAH